MASLRRDDNCSGERRLRERSVPVGATQVAIVPGILRVRHIAEMCAQLVDAPGQHEPSKNSKALAPSPD